MTIRLIAVGDLRDYYQLFSNVIAEGGFFARTRPPPIEAVARALAQAVSRQWPVWVAEHRGVIIGSAEVWPDSFCRPGGSERVGLLGMQIHRNYRGQGHGRALLMAVIKHCRETPFDGVELSVLLSNVAARTLYGQAGFIEIQGSTGSGATDSAMIMRLKL